MTDAVATGTSGDPNIDALTMSLKWDAQVLTFGMPTAPGQYGAYAHEKTVDGQVLVANEATGLQPPDAQFAEAVRDAMAAVEAFTALDLVELQGNPGDAVIRLGTTTTLKPWGDGGAYAYGPREEDAEDAWLGGDAWYPTGRLEELGTYDYIIVAHEIGHTLGLNDIIAGKIEMQPNRQSTEFSIMTYSSFIGDNDEDWDHPYGNAPQTWMMYDIATLQFLYGADFTTNAGNTIYHFSPTTGVMSIDGVGQGVPVINRIFRTIWDGGGNDTYDFSDYGADRQLDVDLAPGGWSDVDRDSAFQAAILGGGPNGGVARGQVFNALLYQGDVRSLVENAIGGAGDDILRGNQARNALFGGEGDDLLEGRGDADSLSGGDGNDTLVGGAGADQLVGGEGTDSARFETAAVLNLTSGIHGGEAAGDAFASIERFEGSAQSDTLVGAAGRQSFAGGGGDDLLEGRTDDDILRGGNGNDTVEGGTGDDTLTGGAGEDLVDGGGGYDVARFDKAVILNLGNGLHAGEAEGDTYVSIERFEGSHETDLMIGGEGGDAFDGAGGDDILDGAGGDDRLVGGGGEDSLDGGAGRDIADYSDAAAPVAVNLAAGTAFGAATGADLLQGIEDVSGSEGADSLAGDGQDNLLAGLGGGDYLNGLAGADTVLGGYGDDTIIGGAGDRIIGGFGVDLLAFLGGPVVVDLSTGVHGGGAAGATISGVERIEGSTLDDLMTAGGKAIALDGRNGDDTLTGSAYKDTLIGGAGDDSIVAGEGNDTVEGGGGDDGIVLGGGKDEVLYGVGDGHDAILGFDAGRDLLVLDSGSFGLTLAEEDGHKKWIALEGLIPPDLLLLGPAGPGPTGEAGHDKWVDLLSARDSAESRGWGGHFVLAWNPGGADPTAAPVALMTFARSDVIGLEDIVWA